MQRGAGPWPPEPLQVTTTPCAPCAPQRTQITAALQDSICVHWGTPACVDPVVATEAQLGAPDKWGSSVQWRTVYRGGDDGCTLTNLQAGRSHQLRVRHRSEGGWGAWGKALAVRACFTCGTSSFLLQRLAPAIRPFVYAQSSVRVALAALIWPLQHESSLFIDAAKF